MAFLPADYDELAPDASGGGHYMKFAQGENRFRCLASPVIGYVGWDKSGDKPKPVRSKKRVDVQHLATADDNVKFFWAVPVLDHGDGKIKVLEITQVTVQETVAALCKDKDWGDPRYYDLAVTRTGAGLDTQYSVVAKPKTKLHLTEGQKNYLACIKLDALYKGDDPFELCEPGDNAGEPFRDIEEGEEDDIPF